MNDFKVGDLVQYKNNFNDWEGLGVMIVLELSKIPNGDVIRIGQSGTELKLFSIRLQRYIFRYSWIVEKV